MNRQDLIREMHKTGCRLDDAAACADVAMRMVRVERDRMILSARQSGLSIRAITRTLGVSKSHVHRLCNGASKEEVSHRGADSGTPFEESM